MARIYKIEEDWLFEKLLGKLESHRNLILTADQGWGIQEYVDELGFNLAEKNPDFHTCFINLAPAYSSSAFLEHYSSVLLHRFPEETSNMEIDNRHMDVLKLPEIIAKRNRIKLGIFLANAHLFHRFKDAIPFLRMLRLKLKSQKNCVFCFFGNDNPNFRELLHYPGPLSGCGQLFELKHNRFKHRSACIRKLFHEQKKRIGYSTSVNMSYSVDHHPVYLQLLAWHALILTQTTCTSAIVERSLNNLIHHFDHHFNIIAEKLTSKQLNYLKALAEGNQTLFSRSVREKYQLGSTGNVARIKSSLENKEIIKLKRQEIAFSDPIFREWLRRRFFGEA